MNFSPELLVFRIYKGSVKSYNPSLDRSIHWSLTILLMCTILVTAYIFGICKHKGKACISRPNARVKVAAEIDLDEPGTYMGCEEAASAIGTTSQTKTEKNVSFVGRSYCPPKPPGTEM
jgi:hypothetical protein